MRPHPSVSTPEKVVPKSWSTLTTCTAHEQRSSGHCNAGAALVECLLQTSILLSGGHAVSGGHRAEVLQACSSLIYPGCMRRVSLLAASRHCSCIWCAVIITSSPALQLISGTLHSTGCQHDQLQHGCTAGCCVAHLLVHSPETGDVRRGNGQARTGRSHDASCPRERKASWHCAAVCRRQPGLLRLPERQAGIRNILLCTIKAQSALQQHHCRDRPIEATAVASSPLEADPPSCKTAGQSCVGGAGTLCEQQYLLGRLQRKGSHPPG